MLATWGGGRIISLVVLALASWVVGAVMRGDSWHVRWVKVVGCQLIPASRIVDAAALEGAWTVSLVPEVSAERIRSVPGVSEARVRVTGTDRLTILVEEQVPVALVRDCESQYWVTADGTLMEPFGDIDGLPIVTLIEGTWPSHGIPTSMIVGLEEMRRAFPKEVEFSYSLDRGFVISSGSGYPIYLGFGQDLEEKLRILSALQAEFDAEDYRPEFVDLGSVEGAYYR